MGGFRHGVGTMVFKNGAKYTGDFNLGKAHGQGTFTSADKSVTYKGSWYNNFYHGKGSLAENGSVYEGAFVFGEQVGFATETFSDGSVYKGTYEKGKKEGFGKQTWPEENCEYIGEWHLNAIDGFGQYSWLSEGKKHLGHWTNNVMNGYGEQTWQDQRHYRGYF